MLKIAVLSSLLALAASAAAGAAVPDDLLVGSVRDGAGVPVSGADVRGFGSDGRPVGTARVGQDGTFALYVHAAAASVEVRCRHCRTKRVSLAAGSSDIVVIVQRYAALESDIPSAADLAALPYGRIADDLALIPLVVPGAGDTNVSDRSLSGGRGLIVDSGVPLVDLATGSGALSDFPSRYVQSITKIGPEEAFRYGSYAGGGVFALSPNAGPNSYASVDTGGGPSVVVQPSFDSVTPAFGESSDDNTLSRRADLAVNTGFAGGRISASVGSGAEQFGNDFVPDTISRSVDLLHVGYSTASRRYRSYADFSLGDVSLYNDLIDESEYKSSYLSGSVRLEHPGPVTLAIGAVTTRQTASADAFRLTGRSFDETSYVEAKTGTEHAGAYAGLGLSNVTVLESLRYGQTDGSRLALVPSFGGTAPLGPGNFYARVGYSQSLRVPTLIEADSQLDPAPDGAPLERDALEEGGLGYDGGGRVRWELTAYHEEIHGFDERRQLGLGASVTWQIAPLLSLRAWLVRAQPTEFFETYYGLPAEGPTARQVAWATYANGDGLRFDAIAHRDISAPTRSITLDGDVYVPVVRDAALALGTAQTVGKRRYYIGVRVR